MKTNKRKFRVSYNECIERSRKVHGDKYIYIKPNVYIGTSQHIKIICKTCGNVFEQALNVHYKGSGCPVCGLKKISELKKGKTRKDLKKLIYGKGVCDSNEVIRDSKCYRIWHGVLERCFNEKFQEKEPTYKGCSIHEDWLLYSNFEKWFNEHYVEGFEIDKDLLSFGEKAYSPQTCVFLPTEINRFIAGRSTGKKSNLPLGVYIINNNSIIAKHGSVYLGTFQTIEEAKEAHLKAKKEHVIKLANKWKDKIEQRAYEALINLDVDKFFNNK